MQIYMTGLNIEVVGDNMIPYPLLFYIGILTFGIIGKIKVKECTVH